MENIWIKLPTIATASACELAVSAVLSTFYSFQRQTALDVAPTLKLNAKPYKERCQLS